MDFKTMMCQFLLLVSCVLHASSLANIPEQEKSREFWHKMAKESLQKALNQKPIESRAKNVVLFLGDGMGVSTVSAGRILAGQLQGRNGEETILSFENFPHVALSKTYNVDAQTPDSAGTATAFLCGVKTNSGLIGMDANAEYQNGSSPKSSEVTSIMKWSSEMGKATGIVTTTRVTHATPAASYAHVPDRAWEAYVPAQGAAFKDIAYQLVHNNNINVVMGGGRRCFLPNNSPDPEVNITTSGRRDNISLIDDWIRKRTEENVNFTYVWNLSDFNAVNPDYTDYLLGLFSNTDMEYEIDRARDIGGEPSLREMTEKAIRILQKNSKGFFLLVEGGRIDHGHHGGMASKALHDTVAFADAVAKAAEMLDPKDTLIVVTADHSHAFSFAGYPVRGNPILGLVVEKTGLTMASDGKPYTTLVYGNGPGYNATRVNLTHVNTSDSMYRQEAAVPLSSESHGGEDVAIYARGPMAHLFHGVHEQHYIAHVMAFASCVGNYTDAEHCTTITTTTSSTTTRSSTTTTSSTKTTSSAKGHHSAEFFAIAISLSVLVSQSKLLFY